jgi:hypothetical protein
VAEVGVYIKASNDRGPWPLLAPWLCQCPCPTQPVFDIYLFVFVSEKIHMHSCMTSYPCPKSIPSKNIKINMMSTVYIRI